MTSVSCHTEIDSGCVWRILDFFLSCLCVCVGGCACLVSQGSSWARCPGAALCQARSLPYLWHLRSRRTSEMGHSWNHTQWPQPQSQGAVQMPWGQIQSWSHSPDAVWLRHRVCLLPEPPAPGPNPPPQGAALPPGGCSPLPGPTPSLPQVLPREPACPGSPPAALRRSRAWLQAAWAGDTQPWWIIWGLSALSNEGSSRFSKGKK